MTVQKLKLVKGTNRHHVSPAKKPPVLSPAEMAEAARFKAITAAKAARQAMIYRILAEFEESDAA